MRYKANRMNFSNVLMFNVLNKEPALLSNELLASSILTACQIGLNTFCQPKSLGSFRHSSYSCYSLLLLLGPESTPECACFH